MRPAGSVVLALALSACATVSPQRREACLRSGGIWERAPRYPSGYCHLPLGATALNEERPPRGVDAIDLGRLRETLGASRLPGSLAAVRQWLGEQGVETTCGDNPLFWTDELGTLEGYCTAGPVRFGAAEVTLHFHFFQLGRSEPVTTEVRLVATDPRTLRNAVVSALGEPTTACRWSGDELWALNGGSLLVAGHTASLSPEAVACR